MGKKSDIIGSLLGGGSSGGGQTTLDPYAQYRKDQTDWKAYKKDHTGEDLGFDDWRTWQRMVENQQPFTPPSYDLKEFQQQTPTAPATPTAPLGPQNAPTPEIINRYLQQVINAEATPNTGKTEVSKALRAAAESQGE